MRLVVLALVVLLTACGSPEQPLIRDLAKDVGCTDFRLDADVKGKQAIGMCKFDGELVTLTTFASEDRVGAWDDGDGPGNNITLVGDLWVALVSSEDTAQAISDATGAKIVD